MYAQVRAQLYASENSLMLPSSSPAVRPRMSLKCAGSSPLNWKLKSLGLRCSGRSVGGQMRGVDSAYHWSTVTINTSNLGAKDGLQ